MNLFGGRGGGGGREGGREGGRREGGMTVIHSDR